MQIVPILTTYTIFQDLPTYVRRVAKFFGKEYSDEEIDRLCNHLSIESFKNNKSVNYDVMKILGIMIPSDQAFIRKGIYQMLTFDNIFC